MNELSKTGTLEELWEYTERLHSSHFPQSKLKPIMAGGKLRQPRYMFVFINPTYRNVSSDAGWEGKRRPWTGTKYIWKIFNRAGHFDEGLLREIDSRGDWDILFANRVYDHLSDMGFYFTNIVKWTGENADLPRAGKVNTFLPILLREIEIVDPQHIVAFGLIPFKALTGKKIKLGDYYANAILEGRLRGYPLDLNGKRFGVIPCYFPVGRGDPKRAVDILSMLP